MPNFFRRLLDAFKGGRGGDASGEERMDPATLRVELAALDRQAAQSAGFEGVPLNRAGDLCHGAGQQQLALDYYGRAVDAYLNDGQPEAARAVAQKIIRLHPGAVRTYRTLVWLDLAAGHMADAVRHVGEYVEASSDTDFKGVTRDQLVYMAATVEDDELRGAVADGLEALGFSEQAQRVRGWADGDPDAPEAPATPGALRAQCFRAALSPKNVPDFDALTGS